MAVLICSSVYAQNTDESATVRTEGFYFNGGVVDGPNFSEFFDYINDTYGRYSTDRIDDFGKSVGFGGGYFLRLYPNFALDIGITVYRVESKAIIQSTESSQYLRHDTEYQVGLDEVEDRLKGLGLE